MRRLLPILAGCAVLLLLHAGYWFWAAGALARGYERWAAERRQAGWLVASGTPERGGWPFAATLTVPQPRIEGGRALIPGGFAWSGERLVITLPLLSPSTLDLVPSGPQRVRIASGPEMPLSADRLAVTVPLDRPTTASLSGAGIRLGLPFLPGGTAGIGSARLRSDWRDGAASGQPALVLLLDATDIALPAAQRWALGERIQALALDATVTGPVPPRPDPRAQAIAWRDSGGTVPVSRLAVEWGPLGLLASGTLSLDEQLQPRGTGTATVSGYAETLDVLAASGVITRGAATAAKAVLMLFGRASGQGNGQGGGQGVALPVELQDRTVSVSHIPLLRVPVMQIPASPP